MITLREVCEAEGVTRRAIQGYEQAGLVTPTGRNERGHLLYNQSEQEKIRQIKFFQEMGFSIKEIKELSNAPKQVMKVAIERRIEALWQEIDRKENVIEMAQKLLKQL
ncbi:MAG: MerR family transcriptional regulator [Lachnospiraceae bacterium]|nr:MerR family transcriptional regulator [Lachnospiraceae bacterium]